MVLALFSTAQVTAEADASVETTAVTPSSAPSAQEVSAEGGADGASLVSSSLPSTTTSTSETPQVLVETGAKQDQQQQQQATVGDVSANPDPYEIDPRAPKDTPHFKKHFKPVNVDIEPIAGGVVRMDLKNMGADAACFCHLPDRVRKLPNAQCLVPHRMTIHKAASYEDPADPDIRELSVSLLKRLVGSINEVRLVTARHSSFACVDGRQVHLDSPRTFGGDFAEMAQLLSFVAKQAKKQLPQGEVDTFFHMWLGSTKGEGGHERFYFYTDLDALSKLTQWVRDKYGLVGNQMLELTNVPDYLHLPVLEGLKIPQHHGNVVLRMMLEFPDKFGVDVSAVHSLMQSYFNLLWRKDKQHVNGPLHKRLQFVIAEGYHKERVFLDVRNSQYCHNEGIHSVLTISKIPEQLPDSSTAGPPLQTSSAQLNPGPLASSIVQRNAREVEAQQQRLNELKARNAPVAMIELDATVASTVTDPTPIPAPAAEDHMSPSVDMSGEIVLSPEVKELERLQREGDAAAAQAAAQAAAATNAANAAANAQSAAGLVEGASDASASVTAASAPAPAAVDSAAGPADIVVAYAENQAAESEDDDFLPSLVETLKSGANHAKYGGADPSYPWDKDQGALVLDSRYKPQDGMQAYIFNSQAAMNLRKEMLHSAMEPFKIGGFDASWPIYETRAGLNDKMFKSILAGSLPQYVVFMT